MKRYSKEIGANEELIALIINSLEDWDNKMQIECAQSFIAPLKENVSKLIGPGTTEYLSVSLPL